jgi:Holliday junction resolvase RusA-like endonuclease
MLKSPLYVLIPRKTKADIKWYLNQNKYRNTHFQVLNQTKKIYKELMAPQVEQLPVFTKVAVTLHVYASNKRKFDIDNIASVHLKYALDALVEAGKLEDDSYTFVPETHTHFCGIDKNDPRVEIHIKEI